METPSRFLPLVFSLYLVGCVNRLEPATERPPLLERAAGHYAGTNSLWFENPEVPEGSEAEIVVAAHRIHYTWGFRGEPQSGVMEFAFDGEIANATWTDSWHAKEPISCVGAQTDDRIEVVSTYGPGWSWRTEVTLPTENEILVEMFNISPDNEEQIAVRMRGPRE